MENEENIIGGPGGQDDNIGDNWNFDTPQNNADGQDELENLGSFEELQSSDADFGIVDWEDDNLPQGEPESLNETQEAPETPQETSPNWENPSEPIYNETYTQSEPNEPNEQSEPAYNPSEPQFEQYEENPNLTPASDSWNYDAPQAEETDGAPVDENYGVPYAARAAQNQPQNNKKIIAAAVVLGIICLFAVVKLVANIFAGGDNSKSQAQIEKTMQEAQQQMGDDFYKAASGEDPNGADIPTDGAQNAENGGLAGDPAMNDPMGGMDGANTSTQAVAPMPNEPLVTVNLAANVGRVNPFMPMPGYAGYTSDLPKLPSAANFPAPPTELTVNEPAIKLMETTISGIMFDAIAPSAIVKVEGKDHLVRKGDRINGYKILNITKDRVVVQNGTNVYRASVGETITTEKTGEVNFNTVDNLTRKFGGASAPKGTKMIQIN